MKFLKKKKIPTNKFCLHTEQISLAVLHFTKQCNEKVLVLCVTVRCMQAKQFLLETQDTLFAIKEIIGPTCLYQQNV